MMLGSLETLKEKHSRRRMQQFVYTSARGVANRQRLSRLCFSTGFLKRLFLAKLVLVVLIFSVPSYPHEVTMNFAYKIGQDKSEIIHVNNTDYSADVGNSQIFSSLDSKYVSSRRGSSIFGILFAGNEFINAGFNASYSSSAYLIKMTQGSAGNRFLIGFTNTTQNSFDAVMPIVDAYKIVLTTISGINYGFVPGMFYMRLEPDAGISNYIKWAGAVNLLIKNNGISDNRYNISLEV